MRLLLTGASGFLGQTFCRELAAEHDITGLWHSREPRLPGVRLLRLDLTDQHALAGLLQRERFDAVLHAAALADPNACQREPELSLRINVQATARLADLCARHALPLAFTSTDLVFDGTAGPYAEDAPTSPVSTYGEHKVQAEAEVLARHPAAVVCRMPLMYGLPVPGARCFLDGMLDMVARGETLRLFSDEYRSPADAADAVRGLLLALSSGARGVLHLGGPERLSRLDFGRIFAQELAQTLAQTLAKAGGWPEVRLQAVRQADVPMAAARPPDVSLLCSRAFRLGYAPAPVRLGLHRVLMGIVEAEAVDSGQK